MNSSEKFEEQELPNKEQKKEKLVMMVIYQMVRISDEFDMKDMGDYHDHCLKRDVNGKGF